MTWVIDADIKFIPKDSKAEIKTLAQNLWDEMDKAEHKDTATSWTKHSRRLSPGLRVD